MVIIENIVEDSIEVKYEDESTTHNPQVSVDLLKMTRSEEHTSELQSPA